MLNKSLRYNRLESEKIFISKIKINIMAKRVTQIPIAPLYRILRKAGATRVSEEAKKAFVEAIIEIADKVSERAVDLAKHAGRKTIQEDDVKLAWREVVRQ